MSLNCVKKAMLAGTALVAIVVLSTNAYADPTVVLDGTLTPDDTWAKTGGTPNVPDGTAKNALSGDNVNTNGSELLVTNDQTANDGNGINLFNVGTVTGTGSVTVTNGSANDLTTTIALVNQTATGSITISNSGFATNSNITTVTGLLTEGAVTLTNAAATPAPVTLVVGGNVTLTGGTGVIISAGTVTGANSILTLNGATDALVAVTLNDGAPGAGTGLAELEIGGFGATVVSGTINGGAPGEGTLVVANTVGAAFTGVIGGGSSLRAIDAGVAGTTTTFDAAVNTAVLTLTGSGTVPGSGTVALDGTLTGAVNFDGGNGVVTVASNMNIVGAVDNSTGSGGTLDLLGGAQSVSGAVGATGALTLVEAGQAGGATTFGSTVKATTVDVGTGSVAFGGAVTGAVDFGGHGGIVTMASGTGITGTVDNSAGTGGTLDLAGGTQRVSGAVGSTGALTLVDAGQTGGATTFGSTVKAATIDVGTGSVAFGGTVTVTGVNGVDFGGNGGTVTMASGTNIAGVVDSTGSNSGTLILSGGTQNVSGIIGGTHPLTLVSVGGTSTFSAAVNAATLDIGAGAMTLDAGFTGTTATFTGNGTLNLAAGQTIAAAVATSTAGTGNLEFAGNGTVTGTLGAGNALKSLTVGGTGTTGTVTGNLVAANTTTIGGNTLATGGTFTMGAAQTLNAEITGAATNGSVAATSTATIASGATLNVSIVPSYHPAVGPIGTYDFVTGAAGGGVSSVTFTGSPLLTFTQVANADNLEVTATRNTISSVATTPNNTAVAAALDAIGNTGNAAVQAIQTDLNAAPTKAALNNVLSSLTPTVDGGVQASVLEVGAEIEDIADTRMAALRADDGTTGVAAGAGANGVSMWAQGYGQDAIQDARNSIAGYNATTVGGAVGMDTANLIPEGVIGLMLNYGQTAVKSKNVNATTTDVDGYGLNLYGTGFLAQQMFLEWQAGYSYNKVDSNRHNVGAVGIDALGNTNSTEYDTRLELGQDYDVDYGTVLTPDISATYAHLNTNGYTETGSGANLDVGGNSQNALDLGIGAKIAWNLKSYYGPLLKPVLRVGYSYAAVDDKIDTTSTFAGAAPGTNPAFVTTGPTPERSRFDLGAGVTYMTYANWDMSANANYEYRTGYQAYSGLLRMTAHF